MAWSVKNYNAWIKQARRASGVSLPEARQAYRLERDKRGGPLRGVDVKRSRTFKDSVTAAQVREAKRAVKIRNNREVSEGGGGGGGGFSGSGSAGSGISVSSVDAWDAMWDDFNDYEPVEIESSADYGEE
jgi:hypothetical protein